jgi:hypothetical protein
VNAPVSGSAQPVEHCSGTPPPSSACACLQGASPRIEDVAFPGGSGRWEVRRTTIRQGGRPHQLLVLADVSRPLRRGTSGLAAIDPRHRPRDQQLARADQSS